MTHAINGINNISKTKKTRNKKIISIREEKENN